MHIYEASVSGILRIILWLFLISIIIRLVARLALPVVLKKAEQQMRNKAAQANANRQPPRREGEITVEKTQAAHSVSKDGDYVDFVEIKEQPPFGRDS